MIRPPTRPWRCCVPWVGWASGAAGDQNPIYFQQTFDLRDVRIKDYAKRGIDISNAMPPGGEGLNKSDPKVAKLMNQQKQMIVSMGQFLGEEVLHVMRGMQRMESNVQIYGGQKTISCPGRERTNAGHVLASWTRRTACLVSNDRGAPNGEISRGCNDDAPGCSAHRKRMTDTPKIVAIE